MSAAHSAAPARAALSGRTERVDALVASVFAQVRPDITVAAVGGYGRAELFPHSDIDLLLLTDDDAHAQAERERIADFLRTLWDAGLRVSQSVRTPADCVTFHAGNLELTISLLDRRLVCGDSERFDAVQTQFPKFLAAQRDTLLQQLAKAARARHARYHDSIFHLEPNVKEHPGGLRDLHLIHWLARLRPPGEHIDAEHRDFIWSVRMALHERHGRDYNVLDFASQDALGAGAPAAWMREYYRHARAVHRVAITALDLAESTHTGLLAQFRDWRGRVSNPDFSVLRERLYIRDPHRLQAEPDLLWRLLEFIARHQLRLSPDAESRLRGYSPPPPSWNQISALLRLPRCGAALRALQETGLLEKIAPEWRRIDALVVRDFYHQYTVDEHTLVAIESLEDLSATSDPARRRFADLLSEVDRPDLLRAAVLFHDTGKGDGGDHVRSSARIAREAMSRFGAPDEDTRTVVSLIEQHLLLSSAMVSRDLDDPASARALAEQVETLERLRLLALVTYADIRAVNAAAMTPWRLELLWRAYSVTRDELTRELDTDRIAAANGRPDDPERGAFLEGLPVRYLRTHSESEIAAHQLLASGPGPAVDVSKTAGVYRASVLAPDRPFLFAALAGALAGFGVNILKAEAFANRRGQILDTFVFADPHRTLDLNPGELDRLRDMLVRAAAGRLDIRQQLKKRMRSRSDAPARVAPSVRFRNDVSPTATLLEVTAEDRPGLLFDLAQTLSSAGCNIEVVLIDTEANRALDVFYVTSNGAKLDDASEPALRESLLRSCG